MGVGQKRDIHAAPCTPWTSYRLFPKLVLPILVAAESFSFRQVAIWPRRHSQPQTGDYDG